jgi:hypothetical protein
MSQCNKCISIGDMGKCQNYKCPFYGQAVEGEERDCTFFERDGEK